MHFEENFDDDLIILEDEFPNIQSLNSDNDSIESCQNLGKEEVEPCDYPLHFEDELADDDYFELLDAVDSIPDPDSPENQNLFIGRVQNSFCQKFTF
jgi:hypothetical protein